MSGRSMRARRANGRMAAGASAARLAESSSIRLAPRSGHVFGHRVTRFAAPPARVPPEQYAADHHRRTVELLGALLRPEWADTTFELRILSRPAASAPSAGSVEVVLLGRVDGDPAAAAARGGSALRLLELGFPELEFAPVSPEELPDYVTPFRAAEVLVLRRRVLRESVAARAAAPRRSRVGFAPGEAGGLPAADDATVRIVAPFVPTGRSFETLFAGLLREPGPAMVTVRLRPTTLEPEEAAYLEWQIGVCERHAQLQLGAVGAGGDELSWLRPSLQREARALQQLLMRQLAGLRAGAALLTIEAAFPGPAPSWVGGVLGALVTRPAGTSGNAEARPAGGWESSVMPAAAADPAADLGGFGWDGPAAVERLVDLFDAEAAAAAFRFPPATAEPMPGVATRGWRTLPPPRQLPTDGLTVGTSVEAGGRSRPVRLDLGDLQRHVAVYGQTGTGKSTLLRRMALADIEGGRGCCVIDPHGDLVTELLRRILPERIPDVVVLDPADHDFPVGLNLLEWRTPAEREFVVSEVVGILVRLVQDQYGTDAASFMGPMFLQYLRSILLLVTSDAARPGTILDVGNVFRHPGYHKRWLPLPRSDADLQRWIVNVFEQGDLFRRGSEGGSMADYLGSKLEPFIASPMMRNIFGQRRSTIDVKDVMDTGRILLVNLAKGRLTELHSRLLGMLLLTKLQCTAMARISMPQAARRPFRVYVDEFQSIQTQSFPVLLSEGRKFGLSMVLAGQYLEQAGGSRTLEAMFGNVGTLIAFRVGQVDAARLAEEFHPAFDRTDLISLPNFHACVSTDVAGEPVPPFTLRTLDDAGAGSPLVEQVVRTASRTQYAKARQEVEEELEGLWQEEEVPG
jgi:hypothetical protein